MFKKYKIKFIQNITERYIKESYTVVLTSLNKILKTHSFEKLYNKAINKW